MEESFRQKVKEYFAFMKSDRNGVLVLMVLIVLTIAGHIIVDTIEIKPQNDYTHIVKVFEEWEKEKQNDLKTLTFFYFNPNTVSKEQLDSLNIPQFVKNNIISYRKAGGKYYKASDLLKIYGMNDSIFNVIGPWLLFPDNNKPLVKQKELAQHDEFEGFFDPNSAGADELTRFGFNDFQASNVQKYRDKGGRFNSPEDIIKIYGVDSDLFLNVRENIQIKGTIEANPKVLIRVELNSADSLELVELRGIGPVFARRIIKYRNLLGGFYSVNQLLEVYGFPEDTYNQLRESFTVDTLNLTKIRLNFAEYIDLIRHPYIEKEHVEAILNFRERHGPFSNRQQLISSGLIDSASYLRLEPYLTCR